MRSYAGEIEGKEITASCVSGIEITDTMTAEDIARVLRPEVARSIRSKIADGEVSAGELVKLLSVLNDRIEGRVAEVHEVKVTTNEEATRALRELVQSGVMSVDVAKEQALLLGVIDAEFEA